MTNGNASNVRPRNRLGLRVLWRFGRSALERAKAAEWLPHCQDLAVAGETPVLHGVTPVVICTLFLPTFPLSAAAGLPAEWQHEQPFNVPAPGLVKLNLPVETLDAARPALEDLRLYDDAGNEVPYLIERPVPVEKVVQNVKSFHVSLTPKQHGPSSWKPD